MSKQIPKRLSFDKEDSPWKRLVAGLLPDASALAISRETSHGYRGAEAVVVCHCWMSWGSVEPRGTQILRKKCALATMKSAYAKLNI